MRSLLTTTLLFIFTLPLAAAPPPTLDPAALTAIDAAVEGHIADKKIPGGVLWLEQRGALHHQAYGNRALLPEPARATTDTIYDAASLTKVVATTPSIMLLIERGQLGLDDPIAKHIPPFSGSGREKITIRHLLTHTSGMRPGIPRAERGEDAAAALTYIHSDAPLTEPGTNYRYSDINYILLGGLVRVASGRPLEDFAREEIFEPLGMTDTGFLPPNEKLPRIAPTTLEKDDTLVHGIVHDPTSRFMGGVAGHAGLFLTASDLARYARMLLRGGALDGVRILSEETVALMTALHTSPGSGALRALGWDLRPVSESNTSPRGEIFKTGYGHTGWTGTSIWIDPPSESFVIFLSNRNHPTERGSVKDLRLRIGTLAAEAVRANPAPPVRNGIDVLASENFKALDGLRIGLITNHTGRDSSGNPTLDLLHAAPNLTLVSLFGPEHGIRGEVDASVEDGTDEKTGLPIHSLYRGKIRKPDPAHLANLDALVFDIQDIGCRFYTYISTMGNAMEAAAEAGLQFIVLDRLNPIGGSKVEGPVLEAERSFTGFHEIPVRHGMTVGELARMFKAERPELADLDLTVVPVEGWTRNLLFDETALPWINPSPNMRSLAEALLYPGIGLLEFMKLSVGRGTATPFEILGAPYLDGEALARELNSYQLAGLHFEPTTFTPDASVFKDKECHGVTIRLTTRNPASIRAGIAIATWLHRRHPEEINYPRFAKLLAHPPTFDAVAAHKPLNEIQSAWQPALDEFKTRRATYLLYP